MVSRKYPFVVAWKCNYDFLFSLISHRILSGFMFPFVSLYTIAPVPAQISDLLDRR